MASLKDAKATTEEGGCTIWGQLPDIPYKSEKFGLGFTVEDQRVVRRTRAGSPLFHISNNGVNTIEDADSGCDFDNWIFHTIGKRKTLFLSPLARSNSYISVLFAFKIFWSCNKQ